MLYWNNLQADFLYVIDLVQLPSGVRMIRFRKEEDPPDAHMVLQTMARPGHELKALGQEGKLSMNVQTTDGHLFLLDPHDIWMTQEEAEYWRANRSQAALDNPRAPWVNHLAPKFAPK